MTGIGSDEQPTTSETHLSRTIRKRRIRALRPVLMLMVPVSILSTHGQLANAWANEILEWVGYLVVLAGVSLRIWSSIFIAARKSKELVTCGPYSLCRNPLYLGSMLIAAGGCLSFVNIFLAIYALLVVIPLHLYVIAGEEKHLREIFGETFDEYARRTPKLLPRFSAYNTPTEWLLPVRALRRVAIDSSGYLLIPLLAEIVEFLQETGTLPALLRFDLFGLHF